MNLPIFQISINQYSIPNWQQKKNIILDALPTNQYTDFYENKNNPELPEYFDVVSDLIGDKLEEFSAVCDFPLVVTSAWFERSNAMDHHPVHNHGATGYAAILYVDYDTGCHEATKFYSPFNDPLSGDVLQYQPNVKEGDLVIFPSFLLHEAPINQSRKERVVVSFNMMGVDSINAYNVGAYRGAPLF